MRKHGEDVSEPKVIEKILRSLPRKYEHIVAAIEEAIDLSEMTMNELLGSWQSNEDRLKRYDDYGAVENAFYIQLQLSKGNFSNNESSNLKNNLELSRKRGLGSYSHRGKQGWQRWWPYSGGQYQMKWLVNL